MSPPGYSLMIGLTHFPSFLVSPELIPFFSKINDRIVYPAAHDGLVAGSSPGGPTMLGRKAQAKEFS
jgi:hypothetical protein